MRNYLALSCAFLCSLLCSPAPPGLFHAHLRAPVLSCLRVCVCVCVCVLINLCMSLCVGVCCVFVSVCLGFITAMPAQDPCWFAHRLLVFCWCGVGDRACALHLCCL